MRAGGVLLSLLIVAAIIFYVSFGMGPHNGYVGQVAKSGGEARKEAQQVSGRDADNTPVMDQIKMDPVEVGGEFRRLKVTSITPGSPWETAYGLQVGDEITKIGDMGVRDNNDAKLAEALVWESYQKNQSLTVERAGETTTLVPKTPLSTYHPDLFGKPSTPAAGGGGTAVPTH